MRLSGLHVHGIHGHTAASAVRVLHLAWHESPKALRAFRWHSASWLRKARGKASGVAGADVPLPAAAERAAIARRCATSVPVRLGFPQFCGLTSRRHGH